MAETNYLRVAIRFRQYDMKWWEVYGCSTLDFPTLAAAVRNLVAPALAFRHPACYISHFRITNPFAARQSQIVHINNPGNPIAGTIPETTSNACVCELAGDVAGVTRRVWFRGLREADVRRYPNTGVDYMAGDLSAQVNSYFAAMRAINFGIPNVQPQDSGDNARHPIPSVTVLPLQRVRLNCPEAFVLGARKRVILYRISQKYFPGLRGRFTVTADGLGIYPVGYLTPMPEGSYPINNAAFRKEEYRFTPFKADGLTFLAFNRRDTAGGPLDSRGHSRSLIRRSL